MAIPENEPGKESFKAEFEAMLDSIDYDLEGLQSKLPQEREISSTAVLDMLDEDSVFINHST